MEKLVCGLPDDVDRQGTTSSVEEADHDSGFLSVGTRSKVWEETGERCRNAYRGRGEGDAHEQGAWGSDGVWHLPAGA